MKIFYTVIICLGLALLILNVVGLFKTLRNVDLYKLEQEIRNRKNDVIIPYSALLDSLKRRSGESDVDFSIRANSLIHDGFSHYWKREGIDRFYLRVPYWENYILYIASFLNPSKYERYEFTDYKKNLERGVGLCSGHSIVLKGILNKHDIKADLLDVGGRHVVVRAEYSADSAALLDPDYGIYVPHDTSEISFNPELVRAPYANMAELYYPEAKDPYTTDFLVEIFGKKLSTYEVNDPFEKFSYILKWIIPIFFISIAIYNLVPFRKTKI